MTTTEATGPKAQTDLVKNIMDIVAKDMAVDRTSRMVRLNTLVHKWKGKKNKTLKEFVARFKIP